MAVLLIVDGPSLTPTVSVVKGTLTTTWQPITSPLASSRAVLVIPVPIDAENGPDPAWAACTIAGGTFDVESAQYGAAVPPTGV